MDRLIYNAVILIVILIVCTRITHASILDTDFYCETYGCVMISDGSGTDVYDVYNFTTDGTVVTGNPLIAWTGNPIEGTGSVDIVETGTTTPAPTSLPAADNGTQLAIDSSGNGSGNIAISDNNSNGYLDASDSLAAFSMTGNTDVVYQDTRLPHSFYLTSRNTAFEIHARASVDSTLSSYGNTVSLSDIAFGVSITRSGTDNGLSYGALARRGGFRSVNAINDLGDISGSYTAIARFTNPSGILRTTDNANNHVYRQSLRFNMSYGYPALDLSQGAGSIQFRVEYAPYKR